VRALVVPDEEAAEAFFRDLLKSSEIGIDRRITFADYLVTIGDRWTRGLDPTSTADGYKVGLRLRVLPALGHLPLSQITAGMIDRTIDDWEQVHSPSTIKNSIAPLVRVLDEAVRDDVLASNPARNRSRRSLGKSALIIPVEQTSPRARPAGSGDAEPARGDIKRSTLDNYRRYVDADIKPSALGRLRLTDIKRADVRRFIDALIADGRGATTVRRIVAVVQGALTAALRDDMIAANPARGVRLPVVDAHEFEPWSPVQVGAFLDRAAQHRLGALFEIAVLTGLRRAELLGLRWGDVDLARRELTVRTTRVQTRSAVVENSPKTSAGRRVVQLDDAAVGALVAWQIAQEADRLNCGTLWEGDGHVFTYENGTPLRPQYVTRLFETLRSDIGLPDMTLHGLRHIHASLLLASGTDIALVSKRLGHSSISITSDIYTHLIGDAGRRAAEGASALIPRASAHTLHTQPSGAGMTKAPEPAMPA